MPGHVLNAPQARLRGGRRRARGSGGRSGEATDQVGGGPDGAEPDDVAAVGRVPDHAVAGVDGHVVDAAPATEEDQIAGLLLELGDVAGRVVLVLGGAREQPAELFVDVLGRPEQSNAYGPSAP